MNGLKKYRPSLLHQATKHGRCRVLQDISKKNGSSCCKSAVTTVLGVFWIRRPLIVPKKKVAILV